MARRSGRRAGDHSSPLVDVADVFADDELIDYISAAPPGGHRQPHHGKALVHGAARSPGAAVLDSDPLVDLFGAWRDELSAVPMPARPAVRRAADAVAKGGPRKHTLRPALAVAAAIAALLAGTATIGSKDAAPNSALWGITQVLWPSRVESVASVQSVRNALNRATTELAAGRSREAQLILLQATVDLGKVDDVDGRTDLQASVNELWVQAAPGLPPPTGSDEWPTSSPPSASSVPAPSRTKAPSKTRDVVPPGAGSTSPLLLAGPLEIDQSSAAAPGADSSAGGPPAVGAATSTIVLSTSSASAPASAAILPRSPATSDPVPSSAGPSVETSAPISSTPDPTSRVAEVPSITSGLSTPPTPVIDDPPVVPVTGDPASTGTTVPAPAPSPPTVTEPRGPTTLSENPAETTTAGGSTDRVSTPAP